MQSMKKTSNYTLHNPSPVPGLAQAVRESGAGNCILGTQEKNTKLPLRIFNYIFSYQRLLIFFCWEAHLSVTVQRFSLAIIQLQLVYQQHKLSAARSILTGQCLNLINGKYF